MKKIYLQFQILILILIINTSAFAQSCTMVPCTTLVGPLSSSPPSGLYCVSGNLIITGNVTFTGCTLQMESGAYISVSSDKKLTFDNTHVLSCNQADMWEGIRLWYSSNLSLNPISLEIKNQSVLEDAVYLIWNKNVNGIKIDDSYLNKNTCAIYFDGIGCNTSTLDIYGTQITCYGTYNSPGTIGNALLSGGISNYGLFLSECGDVSIGDGSKATNLFDNLETGIAAFDINLTVRNNQFDNCDQASGSLGIIYIENNGSVNNLIAGGTSTSDGNTFNAGAIGINVSNRSNTYIENNVFTLVGKAILITNGQSAVNPAPPIDIEIKSNYFWRFDIGIFLERCYNLSSGLIEDNHFNDSDNLTYNSSIGVYLHNVNYNMKNLIVTHNEMRNCRLGAVKGWNLTDNCEISYNDIYIDDSAPSTTYLGIDLRNNLKTDVKSNTILNNNDDVSTKIEGIKVDNFNFGKIRYNELNQQANGVPYKGVHTIGYNDGTQLECNAFTSCPGAVYCGTTGSPSFMVNQGTSINITNDNDFYPYDNSYYRIQGSLIITIDWYYKNTPANTTNNYFPYRSFIGVTPQYVLFDNNNCDNSQYALASRDIDPIIFETLSFEDNEDEHWFNLKSVVFGMFLRNPEYLEDEGYSDWFDGLFNENIGKLERIEYVAFDLNVESADDYHEAILDASEMLEGISPQNQIEDNELIYLSIVINKILMEEEVTHEDSLDLFDIACQNSVLGGKAVLWARGFLDLDIDDENGCEELRLKGSLKNSNQVHPFSILPNPSNGIVNIQVSDYSNCTMDIFNILGNHLKRISNISGTRSYNLGLQPGFYYFYVISDKNNEMQKGSFIISKN